MELPNIRAFVAVVREGGFSAAGRALHLTQPSVSARIARLEETLGERLIERSTGTVRLTPAGEHLLPRAESLLLASDDMARSVRDLRGLKRGALNLGVTDLASIYVLPRPFRRFHRAYPEVELSVTVDGTVPLLGALRSGKIEIAVANLPVEGDDLCTAPEHLRQVTSKINRHLPGSWREGEVSPFPPSVLDCNSSAASASAV